MNATTHSSSFNRAKQVPVDDALDSVRSGLNRADDERASAYEQLAIFRRAKATLLTRHERLLATKLGEDAPRVLSLKSQREATLAQIRHLDVAYAVASTTLPQPGPTGFAVHGYIRDANLVPVPQIVLAVYDQLGRPRTDFKSAASDKRGYFAMETERLQQASQTPPKEGEASNDSVTLELRAFKDARASIQIASALITASPGTSHFADLIVEREGSPRDKSEPEPKKQSTGSADVEGQLKDLTARMREKPQNESRPKSSSAKPVRASTSAKTKRKTAGTQRKKKG